MRHKESGMAAIGIFLGQNVPTVREGKRESQVVVPQEWSDRRGAMSG